MQACSSNAWSLELFSKIKFKKASSPAICNVLPEPYVILHEKPLYICCLMFCWVLSNWVTLVRYSSCFLDHKHVHVPSICYIPTLGISTTIHSTLINAPCLGDLSCRTPLKSNKVRLWLSQKEKMACQEAWPKEKKEKGATMSPKKRDRHDSREKRHHLKE